MQAILVFFLTDAMSYVCFRIVSDALDLTIFFGGGEGPPEWKPL